MSRDPRKASMNIVYADTTSSSELVLDLVMSYLPTKDCVRTSILSSRWRYRWTTIPCLVFDWTCRPRSCRYSSTAEQSKALTSIINHVLLLHNGSIDVFQVSDLGVVPDIDRWILRVSKDSIKTLVLELWGAKQYKLPSSLFNCGSLSRLKLINCSLMPPPSTFKGFNNLKCLELESVTLTNDTFETMVSSCPLLKKLILLRLEEADNLKISASNLQHIDIFGDFDSITFGYAMTKLSVVSIKPPECADASLLDFFIKLPNIQELELIDCHMGFMSCGSIVESFPFQCKDLYHLAISMDFTFDGEETTLFLYRGSSSSTVQQIEYLFASYVAIELGIQEDNNNCHHDFKHLRRAKMNKFCATEVEMEFLEFVLGNSPVLEEMKVNPHPDSYSNPIQWKDVKSIYEFKRASKAKIFFDGHSVGI